MKGRLIAAFSLGYPAAFRLHPPKAFTHCGCPRLSRTSQHTTSGDHGRGHHCPIVPLPSITRKSASSIYMNTFGTHSINRTNRLLARRPRIAATVRIGSTLVLATSMAVLCLMGAVASAANSDAPEVSFTNDVQPILAKRCYACHGPDQGEGGLRFIDQEAAFAETDSGGFAIVPGDVEASELITRITTDDEFERMPPEGDPLSAQEVATLTRWIEQGAAWNRHWAFEPMQRYEPPVVADPAWNENPIDAFVYQSLTARGLQPNPPADRATLIRRASYDLIGLPPTVEQVQDFVASSNPLAYQELMNELLQSPHYGERWGRHWLDLVRFAETNSFERDTPKSNAWKYRDYVIRSFNDDKPYDQFVREQLAGDELDEVTIESLTATGYFRIGIWDDEPADPLQARFDEMDDIITTTGQAFLGLTINCARCHDHKIDPITQADYYSLLSFLEDVTPFATRGDLTSRNQVDVSHDQLRGRYANHEVRRREVEQQMLEIEQAGIVNMPGVLQRATEGPKRARQRVLKEHLQAHLDDSQWARYGELQDTLATLQQEFKQLPPRETVLGLGQYRPVDEPTFVLFRGNPHSPADEVSPLFPSLYDAPAPELPHTGNASGSAGRRRVLADWIASEDNMLTARVIANRVWQFHFGRGLVRSSNNFGMLGTPPTHAELLDYLALRFIDDGWKLKSLHRLIMNSRVYQMSSMGREDALAVDPENDLFWRFDPRRLSAEEVRDSMLAASGSLNREVYGPSVYPQLSAEVLAGQSRPGSGWGKSSESDQNRRSIYIYVKRSLVTPLLSAFDFPDPDLTCEARFATLQPGQALSLLNSDFAHQQAARIAQSINAMEVPDEQVVTRTIRAVLARDATTDEIVEGCQLMEQLQNEYGVRRERAVQLYCLSVLNWNEFLFLD